MDWLLALCPLSARKPGRKIGYAIIGLGRIATIFMRGIQLSTNSKVTALVSGHRDKADRIAAQYGVPPDSIYNYENFDEIVHNPAIDAVYVALPNSMHAEYTIRAAKAGKHVLCEKPMATTVAECRGHDRRLQKGQRQAHDRLPLPLRAHQSQGHQAHSRRRAGPGPGHRKRLRLQLRCQGEWRTNKKLAGGGPLFDVGIYSLNACRYLTGEEPVDIAAYRLHHRPRRPLRRQSKRTSPGP